MNGWPVALLLVALPGCMGGTTPPSAVLEPGPATLPAGNGTYWFVEVVGEEVANEGTPMGACDRGFSFDVDGEARSVQFHPASHPYDPDFVVSLVVFDVDSVGAQERGQGGCPLAYGMQANNAEWHRDLGVLGTVTVYVEDGSGDASVHVGDEPARVVPPGQQLRLTGDGTHQALGMEWEAHGEVLVVNHGAWPRSGLVPTVDGPSW